MYSEREELGLGYMALLTKITRGQFELCAHFLNWKRNVEMSGDGAKVTPRG